MAVPALPTVTSIVTQALKRAGRTTPTATQIAEAYDHALQEVKADIMLVADTHPSLLVTATTVTNRGQQRYSFPDDYNQPYSIMLLDGPDEWRVTLTGGTSTTAVFPASFVVSENDVVGKYILITGGNGVEEYREITAYNTSTRTATVELPWVSSPTAGSTALVVTYYRKLWPLNTALDLDTMPSSTTVAAPQIATEFGLEYLLYPVPDKSTYGVLNRYFVDLSKLDETGDLFVQLLREWRSLWIQGIAVKSMQRFDEDRYQTELKVYEFMLTALGNQTCRVTQGYFKDI